MIHLSTYTQAMDGLFVDTLQEMVGAEKSVIQALPVLIGKSVDPAVKREIEFQLRASGRLAGRLEQVYRLAGIGTVAGACQTVDKIIDDVNRATSAAERKDSVDALILAALLAIKRYKIAYYETLLSWAKLLDRIDCVQLLEKNVLELKEAGEQLDLLMQTHKGHLAT
jgi:ferritin-like metal-binding protein YciE